MLKIRARALALLILFVFCIAHLAFADELPETYLSARALGMGDAYTAIVDDTDAFYYNPGAFCRMRGMTWDIMDPMLAVGGYQNLSKAQSFTSAKTTTDMANAIEAFYGDKMSGNISLKSAFAVPCLEMQGSSVNDISVSMYNPPFPTLTLTGGADYEVGGGFAVPIIRHVLSIGADLRHIVRYGATEPLGPGTLADLNSSNIQNQLYGTGYGWGVNAGVLLRLPGILHPSFSFVQTNIGDTSFVATGSNGTPDRLAQETITGLGVDYESTLLSVRSDIDFKHMEMASEQIGKKVHVGVEVAFPVISVRGGFYQGYYTLGAGVDLGWLRVDAATYGVEMGVYPGQDEDRRYAIQARIQLSFDPDFNFDFAHEFGNGLIERR